MKTLKILSVALIISAIAATSIIGVEMLIGPVATYLGAVGLCFIVAIWSLISTIKTNKREKIWKEHQETKWHLNKMKD